MISKIPFFLILLYSIVRSQIPGAAGQINSPYTLDLTREAVLLGGGAAMGISGLIIMNSITPLTAAEIAALDPADVNAFDRPAIGRYREDPDGDLLLYASFLFPLSFLANQNTRRDWKILGVIGAEVLLFQSGLNALIKSSIPRIRPYAYDPDTPMDKKMEKDARVSFYSGHTATTAALSFYVAKVFSDYLEDSTTKTLLWTCAVLYPAIVGYLRMDSAHHFPTDVLTGYALGALLGYFIPEMHRVQEERNMAVSCRYSVKGVAVGLSIRF
jgi:membrane-associated phospholipid phosphatase